MTKKPILMERGHTDEMHTPAYALDPLVPFLINSFGQENDELGPLVWEPFPGENHLFKALKERDFIVAPSDFDLWDKPCYGADVIVTNPPYSVKDNVLERCAELEIPFALLLPLTALEGKRRGAIYNHLQTIGYSGLQLIIPNRRVNFITPNGGKSSWFATAWFTWGLGLERDLNFVEMERR